VRDILARLRAALLADRWDDDWSRLAWLRLEGDADCSSRREARQASTPPRWHRCDGDTTGVRAMPLSDGRSFASRSRGWSDGACPRRDASRAGGAQRSTQTPTHCRGPSATIPRSCHPRSWCGRI
jgi:hypothetical protein